jgi:hypothetical protein
MVFVIFSTCPQGFPFFRGPALAEACGIMQIQARPERPEGVRGTGILI